MAMRVAWTSWLLVSALAMCGCSSKPMVDPQSATGGVSLELRVRDVGGLHALYAVEQDGTIVFAGGLDATWERPTWTGVLTNEQIDEFTAMLDELRWFERSPESTPMPEGLEYEITLRGPAGMREYLVKGASPQVEPVHELLKEAAAARLAPFLDRQPKAGTAIGN